MIKNIILSSLFLSAILWIVWACERPVPKDTMFCKSKEVFVLEKPFDKKSAIIVMYRGDEVKLLGDTVYHFSIDSTLKKDSADFCVRVSAKRGVIGWIHKKELQHKRIKTKNYNPNPNKPLKPVDQKDSLAFIADSSSFVTFGKFVSEAEAGSVLHVDIDSVDNLHRVFKIYFSGNDACKKEISGKANLVKNQLSYSFNDCSLKLSFEKNQLMIEESGANCMDKNCIIKHKLNLKSTN
jgi:hypothetical protein